MVKAEQVALDDLQLKIQQEKDAGRRILALSPATMKKMGRTMQFEVVSFILVTQ